MNKDDLFNLAPRKAGTVEINGQKIEVKALDLEGRFKLGEQTELGLSERFAFMLIHGGVATDASVDEIVNALDYEALSIIAAKIMELSGLGAEEEKAQKQSESKQS